MIGLALSIFPRSLILPCLIIIAGLGYYEGVPGAGYVPYIGQYFVGRVGLAYERGKLAERLAWEEQRQRDLERAEQKLIKAQEKIDALDSEYWRSQTDLAIQISDLERALENEKADNEKDPGVCRPLISRRVRDSLQAIGN